MTKNAPDFLPDEPPRKMVATQKEMMDANIPLHLRDFCAHLLIPLEKCKNANFTGKMPWNCTAEKAEWDECQVQDYYRRMRDKHRDVLKKRADDKAAAEAAAAEAAATAAEE